MSQTHSLWGLGTCLGGGGLAPERVPTPQACLGWWRGSHFLPLETGVRHVTCVTGRVRLQKLWEGVGVYKTTNLLLLDLAKPRDDTVPVTPSSRRIHT